MKHYAPGYIRPAVCGARFGITDDPEQATCKNCLRWIRKENERHSLAEARQVLRAVGILK